MRDYDPNIPSEMGFAHRRRRFSLAKPVTITARRAVNSNIHLLHCCIVCHKTVNLLRTYPAPKKQGKVPAQNRTGTFFVTYPLRAYHPDRTIRRSGSDTVCFTSIIRPSVSPVGSFTIEEKFLMTATACMLPPVCPSLPEPPPDPSPLS